MLGLFAVLMMLLPRAPAAYVAYCAAPVAFADLRKSAGVLTGLTLFLVLALALAKLRYPVSMTAFVIEAALFIPFVLGVFGTAPNPRVNIPAFLRLFNYLALFASLASLVSMGFPAKLPYIDYLPDYYYGLFGLGGAKIVTIIGWFGLFTELTLRRRGEAFSIIALLVAASNFLVPNFATGIVFGSIALGLLLLTDWRLIALAIAPAALAVRYILFRAATISGGFGAVMGVHPKLYGYLKVLDYYASDPMAALTGAGLGQYGGEAALWASPAADLTSTFSRPTLPGFFAAEPHLKFVAPMLLRFRDNPWAISSSFNKPYSSATFMLGELGLPFTLLMFGMLVWRYALRPDRSLASLCLLTFSAGMLLTDTVHDSPWFGLLLISANGLLLAQQSHAERAVAASRNMGRRGLARGAAA